MNDDLFQQGLEIRRAVLGPEYVDKSIASADDFNRPMQELVTEYCWGAIWGRPGLARARAACSTSPCFRRWGSRTS